MKTLRSTFACLLIILFAACSKEKPVVKTTVPVDSIRIHTPPDSTTDPPPVTPHIDTFIGDAVDSVYEDNGHLSSYRVYAGTKFTVQYLAGDTLIFRSLQQLPAGETNTYPFTIHMFFNDTFVKSSQNIYQRYSTIYTLQPNELSITWTYDHYSYFRTSSCWHIGHKQ